MPLGRAVEGGARRALMRLPELTLMIMSPLARQPWYSRM